MSAADMWRKQWFISSKQRDTVSAMSFDTCTQPPYEARRDCHPSPEAVLSQTDCKTFWARQRLLVWTKTYENIPAWFRTHNNIIRWFRSTMLGGHPLQKLLLNFC